MALKEIKRIDNALNNSRGKSESLEYIERLNFLAQYKVKKLKIYQDISNIHQVIHYIVKIKREIQRKELEQHKLYNLVQLLLIEIEKFSDNAAQKNVVSRNRRAFVNRSI